MHLSFLFPESLDDGFVQGCGSPDEWHVRLFHDLFLRGSLGLAVDYHRFLLLLFDLLRVRGLERKKAMDILPRLELEAREITSTIGVGSDGFRRELGVPWINATRKVRGLRIAGLDFERRVLIWILRSLLPRDLDRVWLNVVDGEIMDTEHGGGRCRGKDGATGNGVEGGGKGYSGEDGLDLGTNSGDTSASTDELDGDE